MSKMTQYSLSREPRFRHRGITPTGGAPGQSGANAPVVKSAIQPDDLIVFFINIKCLLNKLGELHYHLQFVNPHVLFLQETWLDASVEAVELEGYTCISRRDWSPQENRGGVIAYVRKDMVDGIVS